MRIVGALRDWINTRDRRRLAHHRQPPERILRHYWDRAEHGKDAAGLNVLGYRQVSETRNDPYVASPTIPAASNGVMGHLDRSVRRRVAAIHVQYTRRPPE
jgi:hypothetical protein